MTDEEAASSRAVVVFELAQQSVLTKNWDGEGSEEPNCKSICTAIAFLSLLPPNSLTPSPMAHANGNAGLFWRKDKFYADFEFLKNKRVAYYYETELGPKMKRVVQFDMETIPLELKNFCDILVAENKATK